LLQAFRYRRCDRLNRTSSTSTCGRRDRSLSHVAIPTTSAEAEPEGPLISLRYCWFSAIDQGDSRDMCAVDTYDLSGDDIKFHSREYNLPDLLPITKAIEYAEKRDYEAVLGYCSSDDIARRMVRDIPMRVFAGELLVTRKGEGKEHVEMEFPSHYRFDIEKRDGRWLIVAFSE
jgi:hypothetical protein